MRFTWSPDLGAKQLSKPDVKVTKFGGYESRTPTSLHPNAKRWSCTFTRNLEQVEPMDDFLAARGGVESFLWTDPSGYTGTFVCREWSFHQAQKGLFVLSGDFEEVFEV